MNLYLIHQKAEGGWIIPGDFNDISDNSENAEKELEILGHLMISKILSGT